MTEHTIEWMRTTKEFEHFDRKSPRIKAKDFSATIVAFANAHGGDIAIGIEDDGEITGIDGFISNVNELQKAPFDFVYPSVLVSYDQLDCVDSGNHPNHILIMHVPETGRLHSDQADECYYRTGDGSKKLNFQQRLSLMYAKGIRYFEDEPVDKATLDDIDLPFVEGWIKKIHYAKSVGEYLRENGSFIREENGKTILSGGAVLLFGKFPQKFFPRAQIRFVRYEGTEEKTGAEMNVVKDVPFQGKLIEQTQAAIAFIKSQIKEHTYLGEDGRFVTVPEYPEFCWMELVINAVAHRDYGILGTDIQVKMFDDHFTVESPGILPGLVTEKNIRHTHFSRNPKIAQFLKEYELVREFGEGVDRIYRDMEEAKLPDPVVKARDFMVYATIRNSEYVDLTPQVTPKATPKATPQVTPKATPKDESDRKKQILDYCQTPRSGREIMGMLGLSDIKSFRKLYLLPMLDSGELEMTIPSQFTSPKQRYRTKKND